MLTQLFGIAEIVSAEFFGELNDYLRSWAASRPGIAINTALPDMPRR